MPSLLLEKIKNAPRTYIIGNGGSYANAQHMANDLLSCGIAAFTLDAASLTMLANDFGYESVFAKWLNVVGKPGDLLIALSGSGKSPNILAAIRTAKALGMQTELITDYLRSMDMQKSEEHQLWIGHEIMRELRK